MTFDGVKVIGRADRIDRLADGTLAIVDYKTGRVPSKREVEAGFALQLGLLGLIAQHGQFESLKTGQVVAGDASRFEYWSFARKDGSFGKRESPMKLSTREGGLLPEAFLPHHADKLSEAIRDYIKGGTPFTARENPDYKGYNEYDQLMRLDEWVTTLTDKGDGA